MDCVIQFYNDFLVTSMYVSSHLIAIESDDQLFVTAPSLSLCNTAPYPDTIMLN